MKQTIQGFILASMLLLGGTVLAQQGGKPQGARGGTAEYRGFVVPTDEKAFLERLHYTHQMEIKLGQLAQRNSTNPDVKAFGERMVREHTAGDQQVMTLARNRGLKLSEMPRPMNDTEKKAMAAGKALLEELQALEGEPFDSCYMSSQVGAHDVTLGKLMAARQALTGNAQLTSLVDELSQHISQHRQQAYSVLGELGQTLMGVGGAGSGGDTGTGQSSSGMQPPKK